VSTGESTSDDTSSISELSQDSEYGIDWDFLSYLVGDEAQEEEFL
jgi:hypothetical protein